MSAAMPVTSLSHVSLTVSNLEESKSWYAEVLSWAEQASGRSDTTSFSYGVLPGGMAIVLRQHDSPESTPFEERRPGLDHLSFTVSDVADLHAVERLLEEHGNLYTPTVQHSFAYQLTFRDPDGIALELMCPL
jgi:glyoxylase I family protein